MAADSAMLFEEGIPHPPIRYLGREGKRAIRTDRHHAFPTSRPLQVLGDF